MGMLMRQTDSWFQAAVSDWKHPVSREWIVMANNYDLLAAINSKKPPKPYPTPWLAENTKKIGGKKTQSNADVLRRLEKMNPKEDNGK